ncbi:hypothetical protein C8Z91_18175 [Paenibacillus elgii]|uniref:Uncharacterized protein n=1 Tax=Paenibacillus elgii TaxID=189691 RepID=A0A2T6G151_9BACL|nr:hypothetical protein [Paenibacillus elgii]PUA37886.1 hypothetical protein C8Z91_18175 [Paenibacillus elgii]
MAPLAFIMAMIAIPNLRKRNLGSGVVSENQLFFFMEHIDNTFGGLCLRKKLAVTYDTVQLNGAIGEKCERSMPQGVLANLSGTN